MKKFSIIIVAVGAFILGSCNTNSSTKQETTTKDTIPMQGQSSISTDTSHVPIVKASFSNADPAVTSNVNDIVSHYIHIKNALINSNAAEAKSGASMLLDVLKKTDKSLFPAEQKEEYDKHISAVKEHAEMIEKGKEVEEQRMHFAELSDHVYELVRAFGGGQTLYHDHCPMYNNGSEWLSESKEIKNPYMGPKMPGCGKVEEVLQ